MGTNEEQLFKLRDEAATCRERISYYTRVKQRLERERHMATTLDAKIMMSAIDAKSLSEIHTPYHLEGDDAIQVITKVRELCNKHIATLKEKLDVAQKKIEEMEAKIKGE